MPDPEFGVLEEAMRDHLSPDAVRLIAARLQGQVDPEPQDSETNEEAENGLRWFREFLDEMV